LSILTLKLPEDSLFSEFRFDTDVFDNPPDMLDKNGEYIKSPIRRRFDSVAAAHTEQTVLAKRHWEETALERQLLLAVGAATHELLSLRDSGNMSSAYLPGVLAYSEDTFAAKGNALGKLKAWEIMLHPKTAAALGVVNGQHVMLWRHPVAPRIMDMNGSLSDVRMMAMSVRVSKRLSVHTIGLPIGRIPWFDTVFTVPEVEGGDSDGDGYSVQVFHTPECQSVIDNFFEETWTERPELDTTDDVLRVEDEEPIDENFAGILRAKQVQKEAIGTVTTAGQAALCVAMMAKERFRGADSCADASDGRVVSMAELFECLRLAIEAAMDMKNTVTADPKACLRFRTLLGGDISILSDDERLPRCVSRALTSMCCMPSAALCARCGVLYATWANGTRCSMATRGAWSTSGSCWKRCLPRTALLG